MVDYAKKVLRFLSVGVLWVFFLSIPIKGQMLFHYATDTLVPFGLVSAIGGQVESAWSRTKAMAVRALTDVETEKERQF